MPRVLQRLESSDVKREAAAAGFDLCGIAPAGAFPELRYLREWLDRGYAGEMHYMARTADRRADVRNVLPSARSVVVLGTVYNVSRPYSTDAGDPSIAGLARYAWGDDYHLVLERRMAELVARLQTIAGESFDVRSYVDTGPVQERVYAQYAGLGWIGKNTCLISPRHGSWIFLAEVICSLDLEPDAPGVDRCGTCRRCLDACPTGALVAPGVLDSRRCLSYLTIEVKGSIPVEHRDAAGRLAYGCDICQDVCPWNRAPFTATSDDPAWQPRPELDAPRLVDLWCMEDGELRRVLKGSAMKRAGVKRLRRNLAVAIGNSGEPSAIAALDAPREGTSSDPLVAEHAAWALEKLRRSG